MNDILMKRLESEDCFYELIQQEKPLCFVFSADWCPDCIYIRPFLDDIAEKHPQFDFVYVDRDAFTQLCQDLNVLGIPSFVIFAKNKEVNRFVSRFRKTKAEIEEFLDHVAKEA